MTESSRQALANLRDPGHFQWYLIPFFAFVCYVYFSEVERRNWSAILAGLAFWGMDWLLEVVNALVLHFSGYSAIWTTPDRSAFIILVGLNIEIAMMFAVAGVAFVKLLPPDPRQKILGLPNRWAIGTINCVFCVGVEVALNRWNALIWVYPWWNYYFPLLIVVFGYGIFMATAYWVYDMLSRRQQIATVAAIWAVAMGSLALFAGILGWI